MTENTTPASRTRNDAQTFEQWQEGWDLVWAQTRKDETGIMTLPLTGHGFPADRSVLDTHPEAASVISAQLLAEDGLATSC